MVFDKYIKLKKDVRFIQNELSDLLLVFSLEKIEATALNQNCKKDHKKFWNSKRKAFQNV